MEVVACISKEWRRRMLFMFFMIFGMAAWFLYDGYLLWPDEAQRYAKYVKIKDALLEAGDAVDEESRSIDLAWQRHARDAGYRSKVPKERTDDAIQQQRVIGWSMMAGAFLFAAWVAWNHRRQVRVEGETVIGASGERVELDAITAIDRKKWKNKGIAYGIYQDGGKQRRLTLDDHKFEGCEAIILDVERRIRERAENS